MSISRISIIIPTKDRPDDLKRCVESIVNQKKVYPKEVIIVDAGDERRWLDLSRFKNAGFPLIRIKSEPSLARQKNIGAMTAIGEIVAFLDDDCVVTENYMEALEAAYRTLPDAAGIQGIIINTEKRNFLKRLFTAMFFLAALDGNGKMKASANPSYLDKDTSLRENKPLRTEVLMGCATYKKSVFEAGFLLNESLEGYSFGEDYELSYKISRKFKLYVVPDVRLYHFNSPVSRNRWEYYYQRIANVHLYWKEFRFDTHLWNRFAFGLYVVGTLLQAMLGCIKSGSLAGLKGWRRGVLEIAGSSGEKNILSEKKKAAGIIIMALLCGLTLLFNNYAPLVLIILIWIFLYLARGGFIEKILFLLIVYMPFDFFILSHVPPSLFLYMKYLSTALVFVVSAALILQSHKRLVLLKSIPGIFFILLYVIVAFISGLINNVSFSTTVTAFQQELRYIPLFIALAITNFDKKYIMAALKAILVVGIVNVLIGLLQLCAGKFVNPFLIQRSIVVEGELMATGTVQVLQNAGLVFGAFPSYNVFGAYLTIIFLLIVSVNQFKVFQSVLLKRAGLLTFVVLLFTLSRSSIMGASIGYLIILLVSRARRSVPVTFFFISVMILIFVIGFETRIYTPNPQELPFMPRILEAFSPEGWRSSAMYGRTALIDFTVKAIINSNSVIFGLGPGNWGSLLAWKYSDFYNSILGSSQASGFDKTILADVNWASILGQFGVAGILFFGSFILSIIRYCMNIVRAVKYADPLLKSLALAMLGILIAVSLEAFFGPWFASRSIAFYIWLLAGFTVSLYNCEKAGCEIK